MKKILLATLLTTAAVSTAGIALADDHGHSDKRERYERSERGEHHDGNGLTRLFAKLGVHTSFDWDDDDDHHGRGHHDDDDDKRGRGQRAAAPAGSTPLPDNGLFVPGSKAKVNVQ